MKKAILLILILALGTKEANADFVFGPPTSLGPTVNSANGDWDPDLSTDGLSLFFGSDRPGGVGEADLWITTRPTTEAPWAEPVNLGSMVNSPYEDTDASLSADGLTLYFNSTRPGGSGGRDLWVTTRPTIHDPWGAPVNLGPTVNGPFNEGDTSIPADGLSLYFSDWGNPRPGGQGTLDIWVTTRKTIDEDWAPAANLGPPINTSSQDWSPNISNDGLLLLFSSNRPGGSGGNDTWLTRRTTRDDPWEPPVNLGPIVNSALDECDPSLSVDGSTLYFSRGPVGSSYHDLWQVSIEPIIDLNGDGTVDALDMCIIVDHWGTDNSLCDIGPTPFGDGIVNVQDLIVLAEHLFEDLNDPTLVAHWPLDEAQGIIAYDHAADCDGTLMGGPVWQPDGGMVGGALLFDGLDDYVSTDPVLNPADGKFSVLAWAKGGAAGQAVVSQADRVSWLCVDSLEGNLMTELKASGRGAPGPLLSQTSITDGEWHRIALVWDGSYRHLYLDGAEVAKDSAPLSGLEDAYGGLYFGAGSTLAPGTFFSGLIDDVRIYNRTVRP